jgi:hypothetical protein
MVMVIHFRSVEMNSSPEFIHATTTSAHGQGLGSEGAAQDKVT